MSGLINHQVILKSKPGKEFPDKVDIFEVRRTVVPELKEDEFLLRVDFLSVDPIQRVWMTGAPTYLPTLKPGDVIHSYGSGEVIASKNKKWRIGDKCVSNTGAQEYCVFDSSRRVFAFKIPHKTTQKDLAFFLPLLNNWFVAYQGIVVDGQTKKGDTVLVSSAAGATGIVCVQLAKHLGARAVAIAGSDDKCAFLKEQLGADETINYKDTSKGTFSEQLKKTCPKGVDVYFDNVGDEMLDNVIKAMNYHGRISLCGATSNYQDHKNRKGISNYAAVTIKRLKIKGVLAPEITPIANEVVPFFLNKVHSGEMKSIEHYFEGIGSVPQAMQFCFKGSNIGKVLIKLNHSSSQVQTAPRL